MPIAIYQQGWLILIRFNMMTKTKLKVLSTKWNLRKNGIRRIQETERKKIFCIELHKVGLTFSNLIKVCKINIISYTVSFQFVLWGHMKYHLIHLQWEALNITNLCCHCTKYHHTKITHSCFNIFISFIWTIVNYIRDFLKTVWK